MAGAKTAQIEIKGNLESSYLSWKVFSRFHIDLGDFKPVPDFDGVKTVPEHELRPGQFEIAIAGGNPLENQSGTVRIQN